MIGYLKNIMQYIFCKPPCVLFENECSLVSSGGSASKQLVADSNFHVQCLRRMSLWASA